MQLKIELKLEQKFINQDWRRTMLSFVKHLLQSESEEMYEKFYGKGSTEIKDFNYWTYLPGAKFQGDRIDLCNDEIQLYISSTNQKLLFIFQNAMLKFGKKKYPLAMDNHMWIKRVQVQKTVEIRENEILVEMKSPLVVRRHTKNEPDKYFLWNEEGFEECLRDNMRAKFPNAEELPKVEAIKGKRVIVKAFGRNIPCSLGFFKISGTKEQLNYLYLNGLGGRSGSGFGKPHIIG